MANCWSLNFKILKFRTARNDAISFLLCTSLRSFMLNIAQVSNLALRLIYDIIDFNCNYWVNTKLTTSNFIQKTRNESREREKINFCSFKSTSKLTKNWWELAQFWCTIQLGEDYYQLSSLDTQKYLKKSFIALSKLIPFFYKKHSMEKLKIVSPVFLSHSPPSHCFCSPDL